jgi:hypothetical protein
MLLYHSQAELYGVKTREQIKAGPSGARAGTIKSPASALVYGTAKEIVVTGTLFGV